MNQERDNYYILLGLSYDPPELEAEKIRAAKDAKVKEWNSKINSKGGKYKSYLEQTRSINELLENFNSKFWIEEAKSAKLQKLEEEKKQNEELDCCILLASTKGYITKQELDYMEKKLKLNTLDIKRRISVEIIDNEKKTENKEEDRELANSETMKKILGLLKSLKVVPTIGRIPTVYDFFNLPVDSDITVLFNMAKKEYEYYQKISTLNTQNKQKEELSVLSKKIFESVQSRKNYDSWLIQERFNIMKDFIELVSLKKKIDFDTYEELLTLLVNNGLEQEQAIKKINQYCNENHVLLEQSKTGNETKIHFHCCGSCGLVNKANSKYCENCGMSLTIRCQKCQMNNSSNAKICPGCGLSVLGLVQHEKWLREGLAYLERNLLMDAEKNFINAKQIWDNEKVTDALKKVEEKKKLLKNQTQRIENEIKRKRYYRAEQEWLRLEKMDASQVNSSYKREIDFQIKLAEEFVRKAILSEKPKEAIAFYIEALKSSSDCKIAQEKLNSYPPEPPSDFTVISYPEDIKLSWFPSASPGDIVYEIRRKEGSDPTLDDSVLLATVKDCEFIDQTAEGGKNYYYSILAKRAKASATTIVKKGPVLRNAEVEQIQATLEDGAIKITWKALPKTKIEVWKKEGAVPAGRGDGLKLNGVKQTEVLDAEVEPGGKYGYLVIAQYEDQTGRFILSKGKPVLMVALNLQPITDLVTEVKDKLVNVSCTSPKTGEVHLFYSEIPFTDYRLGEFSIFAELKERPETFCLPLKNGKGKFNLPNEQMCYVLPVTKLNENAIIGKEKMVNLMEKVKNIQGTSNKDGSLFLTWQWPRDVEKVVIAYSETKFPDNPYDPACSQLECSRTVFEPFKGYKINAVGEKDLYITLFVSNEVNGESIFSEGVTYFHSNRNGSSVTYKISSKGFIKKKIMLNVNSSNTNMPLPSFVIVKKKGMLPLSKSDGQQIFEFNGKEHKFSAEFDLSDHVDGSSYVKLFFENEHDNKRYNLDPLSDLLLK